MPTKKEIRMRKVQPSQFREIATIRKMIKAPTDTDTITHCVMNYRSQKRMIETLENDIYRRTNQHTVTERKLQHEINQLKLRVAISLLAFSKAEIQLRRMLRSMAIIKKKHGTILRRR